MLDLKPVILASGSKTRAQILLRAGISYEIVAPEIDEGIVKRRVRRDQIRINNSDTALILAEQKAVCVSKALPGRFVIGADQILELDGEIINKPTNLEQAKSQLARLSGRSHELISAVSIVYNGTNIWNHVDRARLWIRTLNTEFIDIYLDQIGDAAFTSPGAYQIEGIGIQLFDRMDGNHYTILGMPLLPLLNFLRKKKLVPT